LVHDVKFIADRVRVAAQRRAIGQSEHDLRRVAQRLPYLVNPTGRNLHSEVRRQGLTRASPDGVKGGPEGPVNGSGVKAVAAEREGPVNLVVAHLQGERRTAAGRDVDDGRRARRLVGTSGHLAQDWRGRGRPLASGLAALVAQGEGLVT